MTDFLQIRGFGRSPELATDYQHTFAQPEVGAHKIKPMRERRIVTTPDDKLRWPLIDAYHHGISV